MHKTGNITLPTTPTITAGNYEILAQPSMTDKALALTGEQCLKIVGDLHIQVYNNANRTQFGNISRVVCMNVLPRHTIEAKKWELIVGSIVTTISVSSKYVLIGDMDGFVRLIHINSGQLVVPIVYLGSPILMSTFSPDTFLGGIITENAQLTVWNVEKAVIQMRSLCTSVLKGNEFINMLFVTNNGFPLITTSEGNAYSYSLSLESWMVVNASDAVTRIGLNGAVKKVMNMKHHPLATVQYISNLFQPKMTTSTNLSEVDSLTKTSFIENQIRLSEAINSPIELKYWYSMLAYQLSSHGSENEIRQVLNNLLHSVCTLQCCNDFCANHKIINIDKRELLHELLRIFAASTNWQQIFKEFTEKLIKLDSGCKRVSPNDDFDSTEITTHLFLLEAKENKNSKVPNHLGNDSEVQPNRDEKCLASKSVSASIDQKCYMKYQCDYCKDDFDSKDALETHIKFHVFKQSPKGNKILLKSGLFACSYFGCPKSYEKKSGLLQHNRRIHSDTTKNTKWKRTLKSAFVCCKEIFQTNDDVLKHMSTNQTDTKQVCGVCDKISSSQKQHAKHLLDHANIRQFRCTFEGCFKSYDSANVLCLHKRQKHADDRFKCRCEFRALSQSGLKSHQKRMKCLHDQPQGSSLENQKKSRSSSMQTTAEMNNQAETLLNNLQTDMNFPTYSIISTIKCSECEYAPRDAEDLHNHYLIGCKPDVPAKNKEPEVN